MKEDGSRLQEVGMWGHRGWSGKKGLGDFNDWGFGGQTACG